uniref:Uncharacterized protein LOC113785498 n=1 Tax=Cicer arietinum TaxID=3827 RepID=A0A3Q7XV83_CICAR|nr:uncharacterized protein LOC113785498 [Cicer arietinum]
MSLTKYLNKNKEQHGVEDSGDEDIEENEMEEGINYESEESEGTNGLIKKTRKDYTSENSFTREISHQNVQNIAQLKYRHRMGNKGFAVIREKMCQSNEDKEPPTQAEMFIATRQSKKGKELDQETNLAIIKLQDVIEKDGQSSLEAFQSVCGKEKPGRFRCHRRTSTPTLLRRNEEIAKLKREHAQEIKHFNDKIQEIEEKQHKEMEAMEGKFQLILKTMLNSNTVGLNIDALAAFLSTPADANSTLRSSTSTHAPNNNEMNDGDTNDEFQHLEAQDEEIDVDT